MATDWSAIDAAISEASDETTEELAARVSSLTRMTDAEVLELFPRSGDVRRVRRLMEIVKGATNENEKRRQLVDNIDDLAGPAIRLLGRFV